MEQRELYQLQAVAVGSASLRAQPSRRDLQLATWISAHVRRTGRLDASVVELGFGDAELLLSLARALPEAHLTGYDIASARVERAAALAGAHGLGARAQFAQLDFDRELSLVASDSVDVLIAIDVLEHVFDVFGFVSHVARALKRGGLAVLRVPNVAYLRHRWSLLRGKLPVTSSWFGPADDLAAWRQVWGWDGGHLHLFTLDTLRGLLQEFGLRPLRWSDPGVRYQRLRAVAPGLLLGNLCVMAERP